jgi:hypothetical protein
MSKRHSLDDDVGAIPPPSVNDVKRQLARVSARIRAMACELVESRRDRTELIEALRDVMPMVYPATREGEKKHAKAKALLARMEGE